MSRKKITSGLLALVFAIFMAWGGFSWKASAAAEIKLNQSSLSMAVGESRKLKLSGISSKNQDRILWQSSAKRIVSVNRKGKVSAKKSGYASITAVYKGKKYRCSVRVSSGAAGKSDDDTDSNVDHSDSYEADADKNKDKNKIHDTDAVTFGTGSYRGFQIDNVYHSVDNGDIHYHTFFPDSYDGRSEYALFITLPGYQGLYFQGIAENLWTEDFAFEALKYHSDMIILAPQLNDWGETSAIQTIALVEYFLEQYRTIQH